MRTSAAEWHNAAIQHLKNNQPITEQAQKDDVINEPMKNDAVNGPITEQAQKDYVIHEPMKNDAVIGPITEQAQKDDVIHGVLSQKETELHRLFLASPQREQSSKKVNVHPTTVQQKVRGKSL